MLEMLKRLYELQKNAHRAQKELAKTIIEAEAGSGKVKVTISGGQKIQSVFVDPQLLSPERKEKLESYLKECFQQAINRSQEVAMVKIKDMAGGLNIPNLFDR